MSPEIAAGRRIQEQLRAREAPIAYVASDSEEESTLTVESRRQLEDWLTNRLRELDDKMFSNDEITAAWAVAMRRVYGGPQSVQRTRVACPSEESCLLRLSGGGDRIISLRLRPILTYFN